ncbi:MAG TPA: alpha/beta hydrolase [Povalibacter sp.]|nr:alpha/beta hydrolase [Povalibacter sp.]
MRSRDQFVEIRGARLRLRVEGSGPAVLLLHGWALDLDMWQPQFTELARDLRLIAFDRRGFGVSSGEPDLARDIEDACTLLEMLAVTRVAIAGMSQGCRVAVGLAQREIRKVSCVILDGPPRMTTGASQDEIPMRHYRELVRSEGIEAFRDEWARHPFMRLRNGNAHSEALLREMAMRYPGRDLQREPVLPVIEVAALAVPALIVNGEFDLASRLAAGTELQTQIPRARRAVVAGAGHLVNLDNPAAYNRLLRDFISGHAADASSDVATDRRAQ